jgi:hypothetical protein
VGSANRPFSADFISVRSVDGEIRRPKKENHPRNLILDIRRKLWLLDKAFLGAYLPYFETATFIWRTPSDLVDGLLRVDRKQNSPGRNWSAYGDWICPNDRSLLSARIKAKALGLQVCFLWWTKGFCFNSPFSNLRIGCLHICCAYWKKAGEGVEKIFRFA